MVRDLFVFKRFTACPRLSISVPIGLFYHFPDTFSAFTQWAGKDEKNVRFGMTGNV